PCGALLLHRSGPRAAEHMRMATDHLVRNGARYCRETEMTGLLRHVSVIDNLEQQIAQLVSQPPWVAQDNRIGNLIGFLDCVGRDGFEALLLIPGTAFVGIP